jgi:hypothetical protein
MHTQYWKFMCPEIEPCSSTYVHTCVYLYGCVYVCIRIRANVILNMCSCWKRPVKFAYIYTYMYVGLRMHKPWTQTCILWNSWVYVCIHPKHKLCVFPSISLCIHRAASHRFVQCATIYSSDLRLTVFFFIQACWGRVWIFVCPERLQHASAIPCQASRARWYLVSINMCVCVCVCACMHTNTCMICMPLPNKINTYIHRS